MIARRRPPRRPGPALLGALLLALALPGALLLTLAPLAAGGGAGAGEGRETVAVHDAAGLRQALRSAGPGTTIELAAGEYLSPFRLEGLQGTAQAPIVITGPAAGEPAVLLGRRGANTLSLVNTAHVVLRHLTLDGRRRNISAVVAEADGDAAHHITLEHLEIRHYDSDQGNTGITTRVPAWAWTIRRNVIHHVGTGLYLGQPGGRAPFIGGLIEHNFIAATRGYNAQIKHQGVRPALPGMPHEPQRTVIRYNAFSKAGHSNPERPRPNLLVGHWPPSGPGARDRYLIYGNLFYENPHERLFQGEGNVALYNNLLVNRSGDALLMTPHNGVPETVHILHNTVLAAGFGIRIDRPAPEREQRIAGNAVFAAEPLERAPGVTVSGNYTGAQAEAAARLAAPQAGLAGLDLYPRRPGALRRDEPLALRVDLPGLGRDYNHRRRREPTWGAYAGGEPHNPGRPADIGPRVPGCRPCR